MAFNYDPSELSTNQIYAIRNEIQDTDPLDPQLQDEEIAYMITQERNFWAASARCLEAIARGKLRKADVRLGRQMMITYTHMADQLMLQAKALRMKAMGTVVPWAGGMNISDQIAYAENTDIIQPQFTKTMMQNPRVGGYTTDSTFPTTGADDADDELDFEDLG